MLRADLMEAGIEPEESTGRVDFHALRATFASHLAGAGVNLQTAQVRLRHFDPKLTAKTYTQLGVSDLGQVVRGLRLGLTEGDKACGRNVDV